MPITFQQWPWLLLLAPLVGWLLFVHAHSLADLNPGRRRAALAIRLVIAVLLVFALADATFVRWNDAQAVWFLMDCSDSVAPDQREQALQYVARAQKGMRRSDRAGMIAFGADALVEAPIAERVPTAKIASTPVSSYTDIARAIRLALAAFPTGQARRIVLLSDGNENLGSGAEEASLATAEGVPIDVVPLEHPKGKEALLEKMVMPNEVKIGEPFEMRLIASSDTAQEGTLRLFRNNAYIGEQKVNLSPGKNVLVFNQNLDKAGFYTYEARLEAHDDTLSENNKAVGFSLVKGKPRVLYVEGDPGQEKYLAGALRSQHIQADVAGPAAIPRNLAEFQNYDSILLSNVSALHLSAEQMKMIQSNVRDLGQGFGMIGGDESFGVGGYYRTPVEQALPVDMDVTKQKEWPSTAVVCVIDKSGSMTMGGMGFTKVDLAKEAAIATVDVLGERDSFGVVCFDEAAKEVVPLQFVRDRGAIQSQIATIVAGGGTDMYPAMMMACDMLKQSDARVKHCILLTDGCSLPGDFAHAVKSLNQAGATITSVAIGTDSDRPLLQKIAHDGGGRFYYTDDPQMLPRIFTKEAMMVAKSLIVEEPFVAQVADGSEVLKGIDWASEPPLLGYVATTAKPLADVPLRTPRSDPLFAHWRYGLGRTMAFTSDCKARWGAHWLQWPGYQKFWGQAIRWTLRRAGRANFQSVVDVERGRGHVTVDAIDEKGEFVNFLDMKANVVRPDMTTQALPLRQAGPGRYEGDFDATAIGAYMVNVSRATPQGTASQTAGISISYPPEYRDLKTNDFVLHRLAERTGGRTLSMADPSQVFGGRRRPARVPVEIWPLLLLLALLLFPLDVAIRRVLIDPAEAWGWARTHVVGLVRRRKARRPAEHDAHLGRLLDRKKAAAVSHGDEAPAEPAPAPRQPGGEPASLSGRLRRQRETAREGSAPAPAPRPAAPAAKPASVFTLVEKPAEPAAPPPAPPKPAAEEPAEEELSVTERLLRAKRRVRGDG